jgi:hypothetical protein
MTYWLITRGTQIVMCGLLLVTIVVAVRAVIREGL